MKKILALFFPAFVIWLLPHIAFTHALYLIILWVVNPIVYIVQGKLLADSKLYFTIGMLISSITVTFFTWGLPIWIYIPFGTITVLLSRNIMSK